MTVRKRERRAFTARPGPRHHQARFHRLDLDRQRCGAAGGDRTGSGASGQRANDGRSADRAGAGLDRAGRRRRLRAVERQHARGRQCRARDPQQRLRGTAPGASDTGETYDLVVVGAGFAGAGLGVSLAQGAPGRQRAAVRRTPDLRWRGEAERVRSRRRAAVGTAGFERQRLPDQEGDRNRLRRAVVARARSAGGIRLAGAEGSREGTAHPARRVWADAHHLGIGRPGLLLREQGLRHQSVGEPLQGCADPGAAQAGHDLDGDIPPAAAPRGLGRSGSTA